MAENSIKKILCFFLGDRLPSTKFRVFQYREYFKSKNILFQVEPISGKTRNEKKELFLSARNYDVVIVQKKLLSIYWLNFLKHQNPNVGYDFDDALYVKEPHVERKRIYRPGTLIFRTKLMAVLWRVSYVVAGNGILQAYAKKYNNHVFVLPTPINTDMYPFIDRSSKKKPFIIGWIGTSKNLFYLKQILPDILRFLNDYQDVMFHYMSNKNSLNTVHARVRFIQWSPENEIEFLKKMSVGLMPLTNDDWSRGKCAFKALQYMATGLPVIASPVGMNKEVIQHMKNGFLADHANEWIDILNKLYHQKIDTVQLAAAARKTVTEQYSINVCGEKLLSMLDSVLKKENNQLFMK